MDFFNLTRYTKAMIQSVVLLGIKHSGKTTQGRLLSGGLSCDFVDTDEKIAEMTGRTARQIFSESGAAAFMTAEENACRSIAALYDGRRAVIATGGGICDNAPALYELRPLGRFVFLRIAEAAAADRIIRGAVRLPDGGWRNLPAYIAEKNPCGEDDVRRIFHGFYAARDAAYARIADLTVLMEDRPAQENFRELSEALERRG